MRFVFVALMLGLCASVAIAAPDGVDEKPWDYPDGVFGTRDTYPEQEPNNNCQEAQATACGDLVSPASLTPGDYDWYGFTANAGDFLTVGTQDYLGSTTDTYLYLYADDCTTILDQDDDGGPGLFSLISDFVAPYTGTYYAVVRHYSTSGSGNYELFIECGGPPEPDPCDTCELAEANGCMIERCTTGSLQGDTSDDMADYSPTNGCTGYSQAAGLDEVLYMDLEAGDVCDFVYTESGYDAAFYILTDCADMNSCVVGADDPEEIWDWVVPETRRYYLIIDGYSSYDTGGPFVLDWNIECMAPEACCYPDGTCEMLMPDACTANGGYPWGPGTVCDPNPCPVATQDATWGQIKSSYR